MMLTFELVCLKNLREAAALQAELFPRENGLGNLVGSVDPALFERLTGLACGSSERYWLARKESGWVGMAGRYQYDGSPDDAWLAWFGVRAQCRQRGYGRRIFEWIVQQARHAGYRSLRLYTVAEENREAVQFYRAQRMLEERYTTEQTHGTVLVFSMSLTGNPVAPWNNRSLELLEQEEIQRRSASIRLEDITSAS